MEPGRQQLHETIRAFHALAGEPGVGGVDERAPIDTAEQAAQPMARGGDQ